MAAIAWSNIATIEKTDEFVEAPWLTVLDDFGDVSHLQIKAEGLWRVWDNQLSSGPDGVAGLTLKDDRLVVTDCPVGALLGRIGGSSASITAATAATDFEMKPFPIGTQCAIMLPAKGAYGSLLVGFNIVGRPVNIVRLKLTVAGVKLPPPPP